MRIPTVIALFLALLAVHPCRGGISVNWLEEPLELGGWWNPPTPHSLDIDENGTVDFSFWGDVASSVGMHSEGVNRYLIVPSPPPNIGGPVAALEAGFLIGAQSDDGRLDWFGDNHDYWSGLMQSLSTGTAGEFWGTRAYIGMEFQMNDGMHYGWFDVEGSSSSPYAEVHGWGYETEAGIPIIAGAVPEPSTIMLFSAGAMAILLSRFKRRIR
jgi:hypothetical protein